MKIKSALAIGFVLGVATLFSNPVWGQNGPFPDDNNLPDPPPSQEQQSQDDPKSSPIRQELEKQKQELEENLAKARERERLLKEQEKLVKRRSDAMGEFEPKTIHRPGNNYDKWERDQQWGGQAPPRPSRNGGSPEELEQFRKDYEEYQAGKDIEEFVKEHGEKIAEGKGMGSPKQIEREIKKKEKEIEEFDKQWKEGPAEEPPLTAEAEEKTLPKKIKNDKKHDQEDFVPMPEGADEPVRLASKSPKSSFANYDAVRGGSFAMLDHNMVPTAIIDAPQTRNIGISTNTIHTDKQRDSQYKSDGSQCTT